MKTVAEKLKKIGTDGGNLKIETVFLDIFAKIKIQKKSNECLFVFTNLYHCFFQLSVQNRNVYSE
jgi:hypothetical protein